MKASVDKDGCIGCGLCVTTCPQIFELNDDHIAEAKVAEIPKEVEECAQSARDNCPVSVIDITE